MAALNHVLACSDQETTDWNFAASTLNPFHEGNCTSSMINDDRFIVQTLEKWRFGADSTGDILEPANRSDLVHGVLSDFGSPVDLVTADGSVDCQGDPARQESLVAPLHLTEVACALVLLRPGGALLLKMFTLFELSSRSLLYLLALTFERVSAFKPATSKEGNSEVYLVCLGYIRDNLDDHQRATLMKKCSVQGSASLFSTRDIPSEFTDEVFKCASLFKELQCAVIERNLKSFRGRQVAAEGEEEVAVQDVRKAVAEQYLTRFKIRPIPREAFVAGRTMQSLQQCLHLDERVERGTFEDRMLESRTLSTIKKDLLDTRLKKDYFGPVEWLRRPFSTTTGGANLQIVKEKPIWRIRSSKFCPAKILHLCSQSWKLTDERSSEERGTSVKRRRQEENSSAWCELQSKLYSLCPFLEGDTTTFTFRGPKDGFLLSGDDADRCGLLEDLRRLAALLDPAAGSGQLAKGRHLAVRGLRPLTRLRAGVLLAASLAFDRVGFVLPRGEAECVVLSGFQGGQGQGRDALMRLVHCVEEETRENEYLCVAQLFAMDSIAAHPRLYNLLVRHNFYMVKEWTLYLINLHELNGQ